MNGLNATAIRGSGNEGRVLSVEIVEVGDTADWRGRNHRDVTSTRAAQPDALSQVTASWFWLTLVGTFYIGFFHVLPDLYGPDWPRLLTAQRAFASFMFAEILVNWLCVRFVTSYYRPEMKKTPSPSSFADGYKPDAMADGGACPIDCGAGESNGFVIDLAMLRAARQPEDCSGNVAGGVPVYSLPVSSVRSIDELRFGGGGGAPNGIGGAEKRWRRGDTIYVVATTSGRDDCDDDRPPDLETEVRRGGTRRLVYPYWSWKPCPLCRHRRPPRAHHCRRCGACVLKRDHHCLLVGRCVGLSNQRHFVVFVTWSAVALAYCLLHAVVYAAGVFVPRNSVWDLVLPVAIVRAVARSVKLLDALMVCVLYSLGWFLFTSVRFAVEQWTIVCRGVTSFEDEHHIKVTNFSTVMENIQAVFGSRCWLLNFIVPLHKVFPATDNGIEWKNVKA